MVLRVSTYPYAPNCFELYNLFPDSLIYHLSTPAYLSPHHLSSSSHLPFHRRRLRGLYRATRKGACRCQQRRSWQQVQLHRWRWWPLVGRCRCFQHRRTCAAATAFIDSRGAGGNCMGLVVVKAIFVKGQEREVLFKPYTW